jgi:micrococcal nuclease
MKTDPTAKRLYRILAAIGILIVFTITTAHTTGAKILPKITLPTIELPEQITEFTETIQQHQPGLYPVVHINDGDTIIVRMPDGSQETVRLLGVDTPETKDPRKPVQCFGQAASDHTKQRLAGQSVRLEPDPGDTDRDKYNRLLRYVYLPDGTLYNAELIRDGYAFAYTVFPLERLDEFRALETDAREHNRGLWAGCTIDESTRVKQTTSTK